MNKYIILTLSLLATTSNYKNVEQVSPNNLIINNPVAIPNINSSINTTNFGEYQKGFISAFDLFNVPTNYSNIINSRNTINNQFSENNLQQDITDMF
jgi:hypothetical protein